ncbi:cholinesterase-like isoform X1 [Limulus polyphemus]|uniref:Cholinesterase-like isoform X1 n=1 Tax=Limulus polyphemus TaxID=6850 RepID=A0ABM1SDF9_LIMPO|nr:cholinesterase-like isoform X1 [Limulus polyphemus]
MVVFTKKDFILCFMSVLRILPTLDAQWYSPRTPDPDERFQYGSRDRYRYDRYGQGSQTSHSDRHSSNYNSQSAPRNLNIEVGDKRCPEAVTYNLKTTAKVTLWTETEIEGIYVYLCDGPGVPEQDRPPGDTFRPLTKFYSNITAFLGIPYAEPPTKQKGLRFKDPRPPFNTRLIQATKYKSSCPQHVEYYGIDKGIDLVEEDCLYLNVFSPYVETEFQRYDQKYPVMVYIHGGDWDHGSASTFPAHMLVASQEVVVVTLNYRLGPLGFLATAGNASAGNYGMLDQVLAIQWVYDFITHFNGDKNRITLFGPGAGAASAGLHAISPRTRAMVKRVIAQSGSAVADWAVILDPLHMINNSHILGEALGCPTESSWKLVDCVRSRSVPDLAITNIKPKVGRLSWGPVIDRYTRNYDQWFLPDPPELLLQDDNFKFPADFSYMGGVTRDEASAFLVNDKDLIHRNYEITQKVFQERIQEYGKMFNYTLNPEAVYNALSFMYTPWMDPENNTLLRERYIDLLSDSFFVAPNDKMLKLMLQKGVETYMYVLNYTFEGLEELRPEWIGVPHDTEYLLITGAPFMDYNFYPSSLKLSEAKWTQADRNMSRFFMEAWANFARDGKPTPTYFNTISPWEPMTLKNLCYLSVNTTNLTSVMMKDYRQKQSQFWNEYIPSVIEKILPTWPPTFQPYEEELRIYSAALWGVVGAVGLFLILTLLCCCLYCRAKSKHIVNEDDEIGTTQTSGPYPSELAIDFRVMKKNYNVKYNPKNTILADNNCDRHTAV